MHNVSQLVCELASSLWQGHGGAEFDVKECGAPTHHQYKTTLNMYEKAKPIGHARCPHVLDVKLGAQCRHHCGVTMLLQYAPS
jgi:hypothetical protein